MKWDHEVDLLVVGSGNGAMTGAIYSHDMGVGNVLVIEVCMSVVIARLQFCPPIPGLAQHSGQP